MKKTDALTLLLLLMFIGCKNMPTDAEYSLEPLALIDTGLILSTHVEIPRVTMPAENCIRGVPKPIVKKNVYPNSHFKLDKDSLTGIETVQLKTGDKLTITNYGCSSFNLKFHFETNRFAQDTSNHEYWFRTASKLLKETLPGLEAPIDLEQGIGVLDDYIERERGAHLQSLNYNSDIDYNTSNIQSAVNIVSVGKKAARKTELTVLFSLELL